MIMITPPNYKKDAIPTLIGWRDPRSREILVSRTISQADINEYMGIVEEEAVKEIEKVVEVEQDIAPGRTAKVNINSLSKKGLETLAREHGVELDRRKSKTVLLEEVKEIIG